MEVSLTFEVAMTVSQIALNCMLDRDKTPQSFPGLLKPAAADFVFCLSAFIEAHSSLISGALELDNDDSKNLSPSSSTMSTRG